MFAAVWQLLLLLVLMHFLQAAVADVLQACLLHI